MIHSGRKNGLPEVFIDRKEALIQELNVILER